MLYLLSLLSKHLKDIPLFFSFILLEYSDCSASENQNDYNCSEAIDGKTNEYDNGWAASVPAWAIFELTKKRTMNTLEMMSGQSIQDHRLIVFKVTLKVDGQWFNLTSLTVKDHTTTTTAPEPTTSVELGNVVDVAIADGNFKTLVQLLTDLELVDALKGMAAQTIFAPSDEAFAKLPEGTLDDLTPEQKTAIVQRHVIADVTVLAADVKPDSVVTLSGESIDLIKTEAGVKISYEGNTVNVVLSDVMASNGVIHVINKVILPEETQKDPIAQIGGDGTVTLASGIWNLTLKFYAVSNVQSIRLDVTETDDKNHNAVVNEIIGYRGLM